MHEILPEALSCISSLKLESMLKICFIFPSALLQFHTGDMRINDSAKCLTRTRVPDLPEVILYLGLRWKSTMSQQEFVSQNSRDSS